MSGPDDQRRRITLERAIAMRNLPEPERNALIAAADNVIDLRPILRSKRDDRSARIWGGPFDGDTA